MNGSLSCNGKSADLAIRLTPVTTIGCVALTGLTVFTRSETQGLRPGLCCTALSGLRRRKSRRYEKGSAPAEPEVTSFRVRHRKPRRHEKGSAPAEPEVTSFRVRRRKPRRGDTAKPRAKALGEDNDGLRQPCKGGTEMRERVIPWNAPVVSPFQGSMLRREHPGLRYASPWALLSRPFRTSTHRFLRYASTSLVKRIKSSRRWSMTSFRMWADQPGTCLIAKDHCDNLCQANALQLRDYEMLMHTLDIFATPHRNTSKPLDNFWSLDMRSPNYSAL